MSTYSPSELLQQWKNGKIDTTQATGHLLQHLAALHEQHTHLASRVAALVADMTDLAQRVATCVGGGEGETPTPPTPPRKRRQK
jgi:hypothetical protein